jgi:AraC-like DNA-binding protein
MIDQSSGTRADISRPQKLGATPPDLVSELLLGMRLNGINYKRIQMTAPFGIGIATGRVVGSGDGRAQFHFVARGPVFLRTASGTLQMLYTHDAVLLPRGGQHELLSAPDVQSRDIITYDSVPLCDSVGAITACKSETCRSKDVLIFSGCMDFDLGGMHPLVALMPEVMHVGTLLGRQPEILPMLEAMEREVCMERAGYAGILSRLADVVSASIVRGWVECGCGNATGWVDALRDPRLSRVIAALHRDPGRDWTVAELAAVMGTSRSVFAERFLEVTGMTPVRYLTELRMRLAAQWIGRERMPIESVAHRLGYGSQAAFSRAFKRVIGRAPGAVRSASTQVA